jgi:hypothetical protein
MRIVKVIFQWLASGLIATVVSCLALTLVWIAYKALQLDQILGVDEGICLIALAVGPALIRVIHRGIARSPGIPIASLVLGSVLGSIGVWQFLRAREAGAHHVPSGPFSGIEHVFVMALGLLLILVAVLAVLGGTLALVGRRMGSEAKSNGAANGSQPIRPEANQTSPAAGSRR